MTFEMLEKIIEENDIPKDVILRSNSGWECCETEMDGVWYLKEENVIHFTQHGCSPNYIEMDRGFELLHGDDIETLIKRREKRGVITQTKEMVEFRKLLDSAGIEWEDSSDKALLPIERTHFRYKESKWSVVHGYCTLGGFDKESEDNGLLELLSDAVNDGNPMGFLTAIEAFKIVKGNEE